MAEHTPGPWLVSHLNDAPVMGADSRPVANVAYMTGKRTTETADANARLIAAAPELLAALEDAAAVLEHYENGPVYRAASAAITKAKGGK